MNVFSQMVQAQLEGIASTIASKAKGLIYWQNDVNRPMLDDGTDVSEVVLRKHMGTILSEDSHEIVNVVEPNTIAIAALDLDWLLGNVYYRDIAINSTLTFSNVIDGRTIMIELENTTGGDLIVTFPAVSWPGGEVITVVPANGSTVFSFFKINNVLRATAIEGY